MLGLKGFIRRIRTRMIAACAIDQNIAAAELFEHGCAGCSGAFRACHIASDGNRYSAGSLNLRGYSLAFLRRAIEYRNLSALAGQLKRHYPAQNTGAAGYDGYLANKRFMLRKLCHSCATRSPAETAAS
jgi:hypothetical protein